MAFTGIEVQYSYRVQAWDFSKRDIPTISDRNKTFEFCIFPIKIIGKQKLQFF